MTKHERHLSHEERQRKLVELHLKLQEENAQRGSQVQLPYPSLEEVEEHLESDHNTNPEWLATHSPEQYEQGHDQMHAKTPDYHNHTH